MLNFLKTKSASKSYWMSSTRSRDACPFRSTASGIGKDVAAPETLANLFQTNQNSEMIMLNKYISYTAARDASAI